MATEVKHALRTASAWTANQAAMEAIYGVNGYYTTFNAWDAAQGRDLVTADEIAVLEMYNDWPSGYTEQDMRFDSFTCDATRYCVFRAATGEEADLTGRSGCLLTPSSGSSYFFLAGTNNIGYIEGLELNSPTTTHQIWHWNGQLVLNDCLVRCKADIKSSGVTLNNCVIIPSGSGAGGNVGIPYGVTLNNCTVVVKSGLGGWSGNICAYQVAATNVAIYNENTQTGYSAFYSSTGDYNAVNTAHGTPPGANSVTNLTTADFVDYANGDYRTASSSSLATAGSGGSFIGYALEAGGGGTTPVSKTSTLQWNVLNAVSKDLTLLSNVLNSAQTSATLRWDILNAVTKSPQLLWDVLNSAEVAATVKWDVLNSVQHDASLLWNIESSLGSVSKSLTARWDVLNSTQKIATLQWHVLNAVSKQSTLLWDVLNSVGISATLQWDVLQSISKEISMLWDIDGLQSVSKSLTMQWDVLNQVGPTTTLRWNILDESTTPDLIAGEVTINSVTRQITLTSLTRKITIN